MNAYWKYNLKYSKSLHFPRITQQHQNLKDLTSGLLLGDRKMRLGRSWKSDELRLKSDSDLHKLWYILLKEKLAIKSDQYQNSQDIILARRQRFLRETLDKVSLSMLRLKSVTAERQAIRNEFMKFLEFYYIKKKQANEKYSFLAQKKNKTTESDLDKTEQTIPEEKTEEKMEKETQKKRVVRAALPIKENEEERKSEEKKESIKEPISVLTENEKLQAEKLKKKMNEKKLLTEYVSNSHLLTQQQKHEVQSMIGKARAKQAKTIFVKEMAALSYQIKSRKQSSNPNVRKLENLA